MHTSAPATLSASGAGFSPNGDGKQDTITFSYDLPESGVVALELENAKGAVIGQKTISDGTDLLGLPLAGLSAGEGTYKWDGTLDLGLPVSGNQDITAHLVTVDSGSLVDCLGNLDLGGLDLGNLDPSDLGDLDLSKLDLADVDVSDVLSCDDRQQIGEVPIEVVTQAPGLSLKASLGTVFPVKDGYRDSVKLSAKATRAADTTFTLSRPSGEVLRKWSGTDSGFSSSWNGTTAGGKALKAGIYKLTGVATGEYGNKPTTRTMAVRVSGKQFAMSGGEWKLVTDRS